MPSFSIKYRYSRTLKLLAAVSFTLLTSCTKMVDVPLPAGTLSTPLTFADEGSANSAMRGIYAYMNALAFSGPYSGNLSAFAGLSSDELIRGTYSADQQAFFDNNLAASTGSVISSFWTPVYNYIYQSNNLIANVKSSAGISQQGKVQLEAEARFLRAMNYFLLVNLFDAVPLILTPDYQTNALLPRSPKEAIYQQILEDLNFAQQNLSATMFTAAGQRTRANKWGATALLARVHLYLKNWQQAEAAATAVIGAGPYKLETLQNTFLAISQETILGLNGDNLYTSGANSISGSAATNAQYRLSSYFIAAFETGDGRRAAWTRDGTGTGAGTVAPFKYKTFSNAAGAKDEHTVLLRLAEQYLIRAEARAQQGLLNDAISDLDMVRSRAGLPTIAQTNPGISKEDLLIAVEKERMTELFAEGGHRWFDLKRSGEANMLQVLGSRKPGFTATDALYPIPLVERNKNLNLTQNPGYE